MKKFFILSLGAVMLISSCGASGSSNTIYNTSSLGAILGSAIGGLSGGHRGHDIGTIVGMAGGAVLGAAIEANAETQRTRQIEERSARRRNQAFEKENNDRIIAEDSRFDPSNKGDDRLYGDFGLPEVPASALTKTNEKKGIEIQNIRFNDDNNNNVINPNEVCKITFEIINKSDSPVYNITPSVVETTGNKHIYISQGICVEQINPDRGIRYTAMIKADKKLKNGNINLKINIAQNGVPIETGIKDIQIATRK